MSSRRVVAYIGDLSLRRGPDRPDPATLPQETPHAAHVLGYTGPITAVGKEHGRDIRAPYAMSLATSSAVGHQRQYGILQGIKGEQVVYVLANGDVLSIELGRVSRRPTSRSP